MDILIAAGGSPHSHLAIALGAEVASATGGTVTLLCVTETGSRDCQAAFRDSAPRLAALGESRALVRPGQAAGGCPESGPGEDVSAPGTGLRRRPCPFRRDVGKRRRISGRYW